MESTRVLAVYGHPDDEGQVTGTLSAYIEAGHQVTLVCCTRGEVGEISDPALATPETLGWVRELELRAAMAQLGLTDVRLLPFRDSGMEGTAENEDPRCLHKAPAGSVVGELVAIMRDVRPHVVFTWDPTGGYGHPDHVATHRHTVAAFDACGDAAAFPEAGEPWTPERLYWGARTMKRFATMFLEIEKRGLLPEPMDDDRRRRLEEALNTPDPVTSLIVDTSRFVDRKRSAARMHKSQFGENSMFARIPEDMQAEFYGQERFFQARPEWPEGAEPETELPGLESGEPFFELRQYRCQPGRRDDWVRYMDDVIIPFQIAQGMVVGGSFISSDEDDLYVWIRRFENEAQRKRLYTAVYESDRWKNEIGPRIPEMMDRSKIKVTRLTATSASVLR